jgi:hypothetical protein
MAANLWKPKIDLRHLKAIRWGCDHEEEARIDYERATKCSVEKCGLFVSKKNGLFAASPDGVIQSKGLLEIKCPFSLKECDDLKSMTTVASSQFFTLDSGKLSLKRSHAYYFQCQLQMYVTGYDWTDFFI